MSAKLIINNSAYATDGGSIALFGSDEEGNELSVHLDWSIESWRNGTRQLSVNGAPIAIGSAQEAEWLRRLENATVSEDTTLVSTLIERVRSGQYQSPKPQLRPKTPEEEVRELLAAGKQGEAIKRYRLAHPEVNLSEASAIIKKLMKP